MVLMKKENLKKLLIKVFLKYKLSKAHAKICSDALVNAELVGATGHGVSRLKMYCDRISKKLIKLFKNLAICIFFKMHINCYLNPIYNFFI